MGSAFAFNIVKVAGSVLVGVSSPNFDRREVQRVSATDGVVHQTGATVRRTAPMASWSSRAVRTIFTLLGTGDEVPFVALDGTNGVELFGGKINTAAPGYAGSTVHARRKFAAGDLYLKKVSWRSNDGASAELEAFALASAGGTDPVDDSNAALPTLPVNTEQMDLSSITIGGGALGDVTSLDLDITHQGENNDEEMCYSSGLPHPVLTKKAGVGGAAEILLTIETNDLTASISNGTVVITLAAANNLGVGLSANQAIMTLNNPLIREQSIPGSDGSPGKRRILVRATFDGTNKPLVITTA